MQQQIPHLFQTVLDAGIADVDVSIRVQVYEQAPLCVDPRGQNLAGGVLRLEQGSAEGEGKARDWRGFTSGICAVAEAMIFRS